MNYEKWLQIRIIGLFIESGLEETYPCFLSILLLDSLSKEKHSTNYRTVLFAIA